MNKKHSSKPRSGLIKKGIKAYKSWEKADAAGRAKVAKDKRANPLGVWTGKSWIPPAKKK